jgi:hypothetical protein
VEGLARSVLWDFQSAALRDPEPDREAGQPSLLA